VAKIEAVAQEWVEQKMIEAIHGLRQLENGKTWLTAHYDEALSPVGLTAAFMADRYHTLTEVKRALGPARQIRRSSSRAAATSGSSCSHTRSTCHPALRRCRIMAASRARLAASFRAHHSAFAAGHDAWRGQTCQKHPWTRTAIFTLAKTMSGRALTPGTTA
jgi:hypothetical protein